LLTAHYITDITLKRGWNYFSLYFNKPKCSK